MIPHIFSKILSTSSSAVGGLALSSTTSSSSSSGDDEDSSGAGGASQPAVVRYYPGESANSTGGPPLETQVERRGGGGQEPPPYGGSAGTRSAVLSGTTSSLPRGRAGRTTSTSAGVPRLDRTGPLRSSEQDHHDDLPELHAARQQLLHNKPEDSSYGSVDHVVSGAGEDVPPVFSAGLRSRTNTRNDSPEISRTVGRTSGGSHPE